jgi:S1-C subfamily serine protease
MLFALAGLLQCAGAAGLAIAVFARMTNSGFHQHTGAPFSLADPEPPPAETFEHAPAPIANAMRANVFVAGRGRGPLDQAWCGAGVVLGTRGGYTYVLTNHHVIGAAGSELSAKFANGELAEAEVEWVAREGVDLGVLRCRLVRPPRVSTRLRGKPVLVSQKVFAIGNPHELSWTYTEGAVSRVHEKKTSDGVAVEVIQTQTPIMPGNSGGGLYDEQGRLVGINTWVADAVTLGPGFAIATKTISANVPQQYLPEVDDDQDEDGGPR